MLKTAQKIRFLIAVSCPEVGLQRYLG